jgi:iron complex outermembrane recepter protein
MLKLYSKAVIPLILCLVVTANLFAQSSVSGTVSDGATKETLAGVNIVVKGKVVGTITNVNGEYNLKINQEPPFTLVYSFIGFRTQEIEVKDANTTGLNVTLEEETLLGQEIVVSASRAEESIMKSPVSIEKMDILAVQQTGADNYYKGLANLKGVDVTTSSVNFQIINARGFNSTGNTRFVQLTDGMDTQAPALNFPIGNLNGPSELDVESVEMIPGAASALYGPNAFNGILLVKSKSPFEYQGLSAFAKLGVNHVGDSQLDTEGQAGASGKIGPGGAQPMQEYALRYAKAFNNKFAFKVALSYMQATDWYGTNQRDKAAIQNTTTGINPGAERVHSFGDEVGTNVALLGLSSAFTTGINAAGLGSFLPYLPNQVVSRTPYQEQFLVDYNAKNLKANVALHYRITDKIELIGQWNYGGGTSVYTGAQRYSLKDFFINQAKLELKGDNFFLRGYTTAENSGDSYIADLTGVLVNRAWKSDSQWFGDYSAGYLTALAQGGFNPALGQDPSAALINAAHLAGRANADNGRFLPGSQQFEDAKRTARSAVIPGGSLFADKTAMYHYEGQYNFKNQVKFMELMVGASFRYFDLQSNGTIFPDGPNNKITIQETGAYVQAAKKVLDDKLKITGSVRYDKNQNFNAQFNPRISAVFSPTEKHNFRVSLQTGFRNPTTQAQHIDLNVLTARLLGGLPYYAQKYDIFNNAYTQASVNDYTRTLTQNLANPAYVAGLGGRANAGLALGDPSTLARLQPITGFSPVKPEQVRSIEVGYKGLIGDKILFDIAYYYNSYTNFITQLFLRKAAGPIDASVPQTPGFIFDPRTEQNVRNAQTLLTPGSFSTVPGGPLVENSFSTYTNFNQEVTSQGIAAGLEYSLPKGYRLTGNYNWNRLNTALTPGFLAEFNTPEHKFNLGFGNRKLTDKIGFNVNYRYQNAFLWESTFAQGIVPEVGVVDAQISYRLKDIKSMIKIGGSNLTNERYVLNYGGPTLGAVYYVSITFDELMN